MRDLHLHQSLHLSLFAGCLENNGDGYTVLYSPLCLHKDCMIVQWAAVTGNGNYSTLIRVMVSAAASGGNMVFIEPFAQGGFELLNRCPVIHVYLQESPIAMP